MRPDLLGQGNGARGLLSRVQSIYVGWGLETSIKQLKSYTDQKYFILSLHE